MPASASSASSCSRSQCPTRSVYAALRGNVCTCIDSSTWLLRSLPNDNSFQLGREKRRRRTYRHMPYSSSFCATIAHPHPHRGSALYFASFSEWRPKNNNSKLQRCFRIACSTSKQNLSSPRISARAGPARPHAPQPS